MSDAKAPDSGYPRFPDLVDLARQVEMNSYKVLSLMQAQLYDIKDEVDEHPTPSGYMHQLENYLNDTNENLNKIFKVLDISGLGE